MWIFRRFRAVFAFTALVALTACTSWQAQGIYGMGPTLSQLPSSVRVTLRAGEQVTLVRPRILGDTLLVGRSTRHGPESFLIPLASVQLLEARRFNAGKTTIVVFVATMVGVGAYKLIRAFADAAPG